jgi:hypothetical protein
VVLLEDDEVLLSGLVVLEPEEVWSLSLERSRGELESLEVPRGRREELRPWALRRLGFAVSPLESLLFWVSSDLLRSALVPEGVALESDEVELPLALSWAEVEDVPSPFILLLSDLLSGVVLEALGVVLELVSWLCARAPEAASASARTDDAMNLIKYLRGLLVYAKVGDAGPHSQRTTPREAARGPGGRALEGP